MQSPIFKISSLCCLAHFSTMRGGVGEFPPLRRLSTFWFLNICLNFESSFTFCSKFQLKAWKSWNEKIFQTFFCRTSRLGKNAFEAKNGVRWMSWILDSFDAFVSLGRAGVGSNLRTPKRPLAPIDIVRELSRTALVLQCSMRLKYPSLLLIFLGLIQNRDHFKIGHSTSLHSGKG